MAEPIDLSGLSGWVTFAELPTADVPREPGVYVVVRPTDDPPQFLAESPAGHVKGKDPTVPVAELDELWVDGTRVVYIGKANVGIGKRRRGLRKRLDEFRRFGAGKRSRHSGGRRIWHLADHGELLVGWRVTDNLDAVSTETAMLADFVARFERLPFANMRR